MAGKGKKPPTKKTSPDGTVTRIVATDNKIETKKVTTKKSAAKPDKKATQTVDDSPRRAPLVAMGGYFVGAWQELRQVRWPNRRATWSLTLAMLAFTAFFVVFILLLDALFKYLFQLILG